MPSDNNLNYLIDLYLRDHRLFDFIICCLGFAKCFLYIVTFIDILKEA